jgi:hypothetical protein
VKTSPQHASAPRAPTPSVGITVTEGGRPPARRALLAPVVHYLLTAIAIVTGAIVLAVYGLLTTWYG